MHASIFGSSGNRVGRSRGPGDSDFVAVFGPRRSWPASPGARTRPRWLAKGLLQSSNMIEIEIPLFRLSCGQHFLLDSFLGEAPARVGDLLPMPSQRPARVR